MTVYSIWHQIRTAALDDGTRSPTKLGSLPNIRLESPVYASMDNLPLIMGMRAVLHIVPFPKRTTIRFGCSTQTLKQKIRILISGQVGWIAPPERTDRQAHLSLPLIHWGRSSLAWRAGMACRRKRRASPASWPSSWPTPLKAPRRQMDAARLQVVCAAGSDMGDPYTVDREPLFKPMKPSPNGDRRFCFIYFGGG